MWTTRILTTHDDLVTFRAHYEERASTSVSLDYLRGTQVRAFFEGARMKGGYVFNLTGDYRYLAALPDDVVIPAKLDRDDTCEGTCIWFDRSLGSPARLVAYLVLLFDFIRCRRRYLLGGSLVPKVAHLQRIGLPHVIYEGPVQVHGVERWGSVYYGTLRTVLMAFVHWIGQRARRCLSRTLVGLTRTGR